MLPKPAILIVTALVLVSMPTRTLRAQEQEPQILQSEDGRNRMLFAQAADSQPTPPAPGLPASIDTTPETPFEPGATPTPVPSVVTDEIPMNLDMDEDPTMDQEAAEADTLVPAPTAPTAPTAPAAPSDTSDTLPAEPTPAPNDQDLSLTSEMQDVGSPSQSVTVNLINALVRRGILDKAEAEQMIRMAEAEAEVARAQSQAEMFAIAQIAANEAAAEQAAIEAAVSAPSEDDVRVTYIPDPVRLQIKEDIKTELVNEARGRDPKAFASIHTGAVLLPEWVQMVRPFGDIRVRFESISYPNNNDTSGAFPNFNAINTGQPFNVAGDQFSPQYNADQDRNRFRLRARLGLEVELPENFLLGFRVGTGNDNSPVSLNQTFGATSGQGGNFSKYQIWLDRAFLQWQLARQESQKVTLLAGRFDNPFFSTDLIWDDDLGFDGFALKAEYEVLNGFTPFLSGGAFPIYNTGLNFASNQPEKFESYDKYIFGVQGGTDWRITRDVRLKTGLAYYYFYNTEGRLSSPYTPLTINDAGDTDDSRPSFAQKGNTYFPIRNIVPDASNDFGAINQWQYYGLATKFQNLAFTGRLDYDGFEPIQISLIGEIVWNLAFDKGAINEVAVNNRSGVDDFLSDDIGEYEGSGMGWIVGLRFGNPALKKRWDWNAGVTYRWIGSDSVIDGFNDSDFGLGGTNMQGFTVQAALAVSPNVWFGARWMGSDSIAGPQLNVNVFQIDLNARF